MLFNIRRIEYRLLSEAQVVAGSKGLGSCRNLSDIVEVFWVADSEELELLGGENPHPPPQYKVGHLVLLSPICCS